MSRLVYVLNGCPNLKHLGRDPGCPEHLRCAGDRDPHFECAQREEIRHHSFVSGCADGVIAEFGTQGYPLALRRTVRLIKEKAARRCVRGT
jgi:hypothetical protein